MSELPTGHFRPTTKTTSCAEVLAGQPEPPKYFATMKAVNRDGPPPTPPMTDLPEIDLAAFERAIEAGTPVIDVRSTADFAAGHLPKVLNIPTGTSFITWAGIAASATTATSFSSPTIRSASCERGTDCR